MEEHKRRKTDVAAAAPAVKTDRISALPDDIIHHILTFLDQSLYGNPYNLSILSKRWNQILLSCPILKFDDSNLSSKQPHEKITAAEACKKFFQLRSSSDCTTFPVQSVRISIDCWRWWLDNYVFLTGFLDSILDSSSKISPREIHIHADWHGGHSYVIPSTSLHDQFFRSLTVLNLKRCGFPDGISFEGLGISLKLLRLESVSFPSEGILDTMIACASRLETLELCRINRFHVTNHPNLKSISAYARKFEIVGVRSLEILKISGMRLSCFRVSSTPNLKVLDIEDNSDEDFEYKELMKLISEFPSLESITFYDYRHKFTLTNTNKLRQVKLYQIYSSVLEIDASGVDDFITCFLTILCKLDRKRIELVPLTLPELREQLVPLILPKLTQFRVIALHISDLIIWDKATSYEYPTPAIEHLKFSSYLEIEMDKNFLEGALQTCHPNFISFPSPKEKHRLALQGVCKQLVERAPCVRCESGYKCWHNQLKNVKLVTRFTNGDIREDEVIDVSKDTLVSSLVEGDEVRFRLTWRLRTKPVCKKVQYLFKFI